MTDQMVSQRCRLQARRLAAQRPEAILPNPTVNTSNRHAQQALPYPSSLTRQSPEWQPAPSKTDTLLTDFPPVVCLCRACDAKEPHTHSYGKVNITDKARCYSPEVETPPAGQEMPSPKTNSTALVRVDSETDESPTPSPAPKPKNLTPTPAKSENINPALHNLTIEKESQISSTHHIRPMPAHDADDYRRDGNWHTPRNPT